jgi:hypothetical protein
MRQKQEKKAAELLEKKDNAPSSSSAKKWIMLQLDILPNFNTF